MKIGDKIKSDKWTYTTNGNIYTVVDVRNLGAVNATCNATPDDEFEWFFYASEYTPCTPTTGTLQELNVKAGDVVECVDDRDSTVYTTGKQYGCPKDGWAYDNFKTNTNESSCDETYSIFKIASRASSDTTPTTPRTWGELTDAEKGALLLADHEGKVIQYWDGGFFDIEHGVGWFDDDIYRIKPEPVVETTTFKWWVEDDNTGLQTSKKYDISIDTIDGIPDTSSIRMVDNNE